MHGVECSDISVHFTFAWTTQHLYKFEVSASKWQMRFIFILRTGGLNIVQLNWNEINKWLVPFLLCYQTDQKEYVGWSKNGSLRGTIKKTGKSAPLRSKIWRRGIFGFQPEIFRVMQLMNYERILVSNLDISKKVFGQLSK